MLELAVKLPASMPLRAPDLECRRKVSGWVGGWVGGETHQLLLQSYSHAVLLRALVMQLGPALWCPHSAEGWHLMPQLLLLALPPCLPPLQVGVSEGRLRKWLLSISAFLRMQVRVGVTPCLRVRGPMPCRACASASRLEPAAECARGSGLRSPRTNIYPACLPAGPPAAEWQRGGGHQPVEAKCGQGV
jgi:hypothetical protein